MVPQVRRSAGTGLRQPFVKLGRFGGGWLREGADAARSLVTDVFV